VLPIETTTGAWPTADALHRKLVGASVSERRTTAQLPTARTTNVLEKAAAALERTDFPKEGFPRTNHKKTPRNLNRLPSATATSGILAGYSALTLTLRALELALCQNTTSLPHDFGL